jgi:hypothetical protein
LGIKRIGVVSDLHCGSIFGMMPPHFMASDGRECKQNPGQAYLWECWEDAAKHMGKFDALIVNGDVVDGCQFRQGGMEFCLPMREDQAAAAEHCLRYLWKKIGKPRLYFIQGTEYHDARVGREVEVIARNLGAVKYRGLGTGRYSREVLDLQIDGTIINFAHGISASGGLYRATAPDREGVWSALAGKAGKSPKADCVVRSHIHSYVHVEHASKHIVITPCWQLQTRFMRRNSAYRMIPDIGFVVITVDDQAKQKGGDPCRIEKRLYPLPPMRPVKF